MTDYEFQYSLNGAPEARSDGTGLVDHQVTAMVREQGSSDPFVVMPQRNKTFLIPAADLLSIMALPDGSGAQKTAKNAAYKSLLADNLNTAANPLSGWSEAELEAFMDANDQSADAASQADDYIVNVLEQSYPVQFNV